MATTTKTNGYSPRTALYVYLGAGKFFVDKTKELSGKAVELAQHQRKIVIKTIDDFGDRGQKLYTSISKNASTKRAIDQVKTARSRVKAASTSVTKAVDATAKATRSAAKKVS